MVYRTSDRSLIGRLFGSLGTSETLLIQSVKKELETTQTPTLDEEAQDELSHNFLDSLIYVMLPVSTKHIFIESIDTRNVRTRPPRTDFTDF